MLWLYLPIYICVSITSYWIYLAICVCICCNLYMWVYTYIAVYMQSVYSVCSLYKYTGIIIYNIAYRYILCMCPLSHVWLFATLWTIAHETLCMAFPRQEYWSELKHKMDGWWQFFAETLLWLPMSLNKRRNPTMTNMALYHRPSLHSLSPFPSPLYTNSVGFLTVSGQTWLGST